MNKFNTKKWFLYFVIFVGVVGVIVGVILAITNKSKPPPPPPNGGGGGGGGNGGNGGGFKPDPNKSDVDNTIAALQYVNATMYGAATCGNTQAQLQKFNGKISKQTPMGIYVECSENVSDTPISQCLTYFKQFAQNGDISIAYPTWSINGKKIEGVQQLTDLYRYAIGSPKSSMFSELDFNSGSNNYSTNVTFTEV